MTKASDLAVEGELMEAWMKKYGQRQRRMPRQTSKRQRPPRQISEKFIRLTHKWARRLWKHRVGAAGWYLLAELDRLIHESGGGNPVKLTTKVLKSMQLSRWKAWHALCQLEKAGAVKVARYRGRAPLVDAIWYWKP